jgi:4-amino-4-deoxy-L-arabinose transferase-like glycosyltransferase
MPTQNPLPRSALFLLVAAFAAVWFAGIGTRALMHPDEGRYAEIPREMTVSGDWVTPRLNGLKYFEKPPLQYWMTAAAYEAFGVHTWTARLWPVLSTLGATLFVGFVGLRLGGPRLGLYAAAALAGCGGYVINAHLLTLDGSLCAWLTLAFGAFLLAQRETPGPAERRRWMWIAWAAMAAATLTKGLVGIVIPGASLVFYSLATRDFAVWRRVYLPTGLVVYLVLAAPWFIAVARANDEFLRFFFIHEHFERFLTTEHRRVEPWWYFAPLLVGGMIPWTVMLGWGVRRCWRGGQPAANGFSWQRFALVWSAFVFVFFSASGSKLPSYILPMFPVLALVAGWLMCGATPEQLARLVAWPYALGAGVLLAAALAAFEPIVRRFVGDPGTLASLLAYAPWIEGALATAAAGGALALLALRRPTAGRPMLAVLAVAASTLVALQLALAGADHFRTIRSSRDILGAAEAVNGPFAPGVPFYSVHMYDQTVPFYLQRTTTLVAFRDEFALGEDAEPQKVFASEDQWVPVWKALRQGYAMMPPADYERLAADGLPMRLLARDTRRVVVSRR